MKKKIRLIHLHHFLFENYQAIKKILLYDPHLENLYQYSPSTFKTTFQSVVDYLTRNHLFKRKIKQIKTLK